MSDEIQIQVRGWTGADPEKHVTPSGAEYARFRLAATRGYWDRNAEEYRTAATEWFTIKAWGSRAAHVLATVRKGVPLVVRGTLQLERWTSEDGTQRAENAITASLVAVDLDHGEARFTKVVRDRAEDGPGTGQDDSAPAETSPAADDPWDTSTNATETEPAAPPF